MKNPVYKWKAQLLAQKILKQKKSCKVFDILYKVEQYSDINVYGKNKNDCKV